VRIFRANGIFNIKQQQRAPECRNQTYYFRIDLNDDVRSVSFLSVLPSARSPPISVSAEAERKVHGLIRVENGYKLV